MDSINNACKFGSDAWLEFQAFKTRQLNRREKLNRHRDLINGIALNQNHPQQLSSVQTSAGTSNQTDTPQTLPIVQSATATTSRPTNHHVGIPRNSSNSETKGQSCVATTSQDNKFVPDNSPPSILDSNIVGPSEISDCNQLNLELVECLLLLKLCDVALKLPMDSRSLQRSIKKIRGLECTKQSIVENLLQKFAHQELITIEEPTASLLGRRNKQLVSNSHTGGAEVGDDEFCIYVTSADHTKLVDFDKSYGSLESIRALLLESKVEDSTLEEGEVTNNNPNTSNPLQSVRSSTSNELSDRGESSSSSTNDNLKVSKLSLDKSSDLIDLESLTNFSNGLSKNSSQINSKRRQLQVGDDIESLLSLSSTREKESKKLGEELLELLSKPTAKERNLLERFRSADGYQVQEFCPKGTKGECQRHNKGAGFCDKLHFKKIIAKHTEESLGDCSFLNTCFHMDSCKYVHYEVDYDEKSLQERRQFKRPRPSEVLGTKQRHDSMAATMTINTSNTSSTLKAASHYNDSNNNSKSSMTSISSQSATKYTLSLEDQARIDAKNRNRFKTVLYPPQWIQCDLRFFDMSLLGKFSVIMADPPWDIHMELPYGTMSDDEMRKLNIPALQDEGVIFLWVTGRAMELGRECLALWGYERCDEIIWVKTNQLQRIIRTGRTGHWLNHGKEHCLVGVKGNPKDINRGLDCDVIVAEVRATSHKPDEIYGIIERLSPGTRKIELFGRAHNVQPNWITLGNQLSGVRLVEPSLVNAFKKLNLPFQTSEHVS